MRQTKENLRRNEEKKRRATAKKTAEKVELAVGITSFMSHVTFLESITISFIFIVTHIPWLYTFYTRDRSISTFFQIDKLSIFLAR